jgi:hypothetical protein
MSALALDTYALVLKLKEAGVPEQQAAIQVETITKAIDSALEQARHDYKLDDLVTRRDLKELETELKRDIEAMRLESKRDIEVLRADTKAQIAEAKAELIRWVVGVGVLQTALITGVLLKLTHLI